MQTRAETKRTLLLLSPLTAAEPDGQAVSLPRKYALGLEEFAKRWQGPATVLLPRANKQDDNLDYTPVNRATMPYTLAALPDDERLLREYIRTAAVVMMPLLARYVQIPSLCAPADVPFVLDADLTPAIREEIIRTENRNPLLRWRRLYWQRNMEKHYTAMARAAQGMQLNGLTAFQAYRSLNRAPLLYFNTRVRRTMMPTAQEPGMRTERLRRGMPLRLVYSGRWRAIKGVLDLPRTAVELRRLGVHAEWDIYGGGGLEQELARAIADAGLDNMHLRGELEFPDLMRTVANECDLFVCCHPQGDPSTTFIEMLSVGIPLVGYDTLGLYQLVRASGAGWLTPRNDPAALAKQIAELDRNREALVAATSAAAKFTSDKSFEDLMEQRVAHLSTIAERAGA